MMATRIIDNSIFHMAFPPFHKNRILELRSATPAFYKNDISFKEAEKLLQFIRRTYSDIINMKQIRVCGSASSHLLGKTKEV